MRRFLFGMAIASFTVAAPMTALAGDREIADAIISTLKQKQPLARSRLRHRLER